MAELLEHSRRLSGECVEIGERFFTACVNLRGRASDPRFVRAVTSVTDVAPPTQACASVSSLFGSLLWLGPDEWLVVSESQPGEEIAVRLRQALQAIPAAVTDVSDARSVFTLIGANARCVLAKGCSIDFHPRAFLRGQCVQSLLAKASVLIHARATETFDVYVARSFADYAWAWFENAHAQYR
jgi:sarcosine oxidase subunit gamma